MSDIHDILNEKSRLLNSMYSVIPFVKIKHIYICMGKKTWKDLPHNVLIKL